MTAAPVAEWDGRPLLDEAGFQQEIAAACEPVILRQACADWPVVQAAEESRDALFAYLRNRGNDRKAQAFRGRPEIAGGYYYDDQLDGFNFERATVTLEEALQEIATCAQQPDLGTVYVGSLPCGEHLPSFAAENRLPFLSSAVEPRLWVGNASRVACHYDTFDNLACVVAGRRRFVLYPPDAVADLYVGPIDYTMAGQPVSLAADAARGDSRFPRFEAVRERARTAQLEPGDVLYLPKLWWHQVEATEPVNVLANFWWDPFRAGPDAPYTAMMLAMIAIAERPQPERAAWRAFFDHYVFRPDGHPLAHLPQDKRGILGPLADGNYGILRAIIMQRLRGG